MQLRVEIHAVKIMIRIGLFLQPTLMHNSITYVCHITILDMFRALICPSSGGTTAQTQYLVSSLS